MTNNKMILEEKYEFILNYRGFDVRDSKHGQIRFLERGLEQLRPKTYAKICEEFGITYMPDDKDDSFERHYNAVVRKYPDQKRNYHNLYIWMLKKGIDKILNEYHGEHNYYIIESKKYKMAIQIHFREDRENSKKSVFVTATSLNQRTMKFFKEHDKKVFVERFKRETKKEKMTEGATFHNIAFHFFKRPRGLDIDMMGYDTFVEWPGELNKTFEIVEV